MYRRTSIVTGLLIAAGVTIYYEWPRSSSIPHTLLAVRDAGIADAQLGLPLPAGNAEVVGAMLWWDDAKRCVSDVIVVGTEALVDLPVDARCDYVSGYAYGVARYSNTPPIDGGLESGFAGLSDHVSIGWDPTRRCVTSATVTTTSRTAYVTTTFVPLAARCP